MTPEEMKTLDRLVAAINLAHNSPGRLFWHGLLWGLGRGLGATIGLAVVLGVSYYFFKASGLDEYFKDFLKTLDEISNTARAFGR